MLNIEKIRPPVESHYVQEFRYDYNTVDSHTGDYFS